MFSRLADLAEIRHGFSTRSKLQQSTKGTLPVVQAKDLNNSGGIEVDTVFRVNDLRARPAHFLRVDDVVVQARGERYPAAVVPPALEDSVAASPLVVIRPDLDRLNSAYLVQFLNLPRTQFQLRRQAMGTYVPNLRSNDLAGLEIPLPPLAEQHRLVQLGELIEHERTLLNALIELRRHLFSAVINSAAEKSGDTNTPPDLNRSDRTTTPPGHVLTAHDRKEEFNT